MLAVQDRTGKLKEATAREDDERTADYPGSSVSYESFGVQCISKRLKKKGLQVLEVLFAVSGA